MPCLSQVHLGSAAALPGAAARQQQRLARRPLRLVARAQGGDTDAGAPGRWASGLLGAAIATSLVRGAEQ